MNQTLRVILCAGLLSACSPSSPPVEPKAKPATESQNTETHGTEPVISVDAKITAQEKSAEQGLPFLDASLTIEARVNDLVARLTLSEKIAQLFNDAPAIERLNIPSYNWWNEALHGVARAGEATVFPQAIGLAASFDRKLIREIADTISTEARAKHHFFAENDVRALYTGLTFWSPNVNIFRDPRWGRGQETYGEDPYLTGQLAIEFIKGMQGNHPKYLKTSAMAKHYAVHSGPEKSRHSDDYISSPKDLHETYLPAFKAAVIDAKVESIMCAYNRINGVPACGNDLLLKEILRGRWQFQGHVVSDCGAISDFFIESAHFVTKAPAIAAAWALGSGTDLNCGTARLNVFSNLHFALQRDYITEKEIDTAVSRLFTTRFKLGMFDLKTTVPYAQIPTSVIGSKAHLATAQKASEQALVLLKNNGILPLKKGTKVAVIGPNATNPSVLVGNYHGDPIAAISPLAGVQEIAGQSNVSYAPGSALIEDKFTHFTTVPENVLFHQVGDKGELKPGLIGRYYAADLDRARAANRFYVDKKAAKVGPPVQQSIDPTIDFKWQRSPIDQRVMGEFAVEWEGKLIPETTGNYHLKSEASIYINGEKIDKPIDLIANKAYTLKLEKTFLRTHWGNPPLPKVKLSWLVTSDNFLNNAVKAANSAEVILFMGGISAQLEGEEMRVDYPGFDKGDRTHLKIPEIQMKLLQTLKQLGKPIVLVNFSGSAMSLNWENANLDAILQAFYPGEAAGRAIAKVLWGQTNPSGRLPITYYKSVEDLPDFKDYRMENRTYRYYKGEVLYPFGFGLSYSTFNYSQLKAPESLQQGSNFEVSVSISNTSDIDGTEVVQLFLSMPDAPVKTPIRDLRGFKKVSIDAGKSVEVSFSLTKDMLQYVDNQGKFQDYSGQLQLTIGSGQEGHVPEQALVKTSIAIEAAKGN